MTITLLVRLCVINNDEEDGNGVDNNYTQIPAIQKRNSSYFFSSFLQFLPSSTLLLLFVSACVRFVYGAKWENEVESSMRRKKKKNKNKKKKDGSDFIIIYFLFARIT